MLLIYLPNIICPHFITLEFSSRMECHVRQPAKESYDQVGLILARNEIEKSNAFFAKVLIMVTLFPAHICGKGLR